MRASWGFRETFAIFKAGRSEVTGQWVLLRGDFGVGRAMNVVGGLKSTRDRASLRPYVCRSFGFGILLDQGG